MIDGIVLGTALGIVDGALLGTSLGWTLGTSLGTELGIQLGDTEGLRDELHEQHPCIGSTMVLAHAVLKQIDDPGGPQP